MPPVLEASPAMANPVIASVHPGPVTRLIADVGLMVHLELPKSLRTCQDIPTFRPDATQLLITHVAASAPHAVCYVFDTLRDHETFFRQANKHYGHRGLGDFNFGQWETASRLAGDKIVWNLNTATQDRLIPLPGRAPIACYLSPRLRADRDFMLEMMQYDPFNWVYIAEGLRDDSRLLATLQKSPTAAQLVLSLFGKNVQAA